MLKFNTLIKSTGLALVFLTVLFLLLVTVRGSHGDGLGQAKMLTANGQAFESSISAGRYALLLSIVDNGSLNLSQELADFAAPDVSQTPDGRFVSIWPPGSAFLLVPFYFVGKLFGFGQLTVGLVVSALALINGYLVYHLGKRLGLKKYTALFSGMLYVFASNSFVYSAVLSQHQFTTLILLLSICVSMYKSTFLKHSVLWFLYGSSILVDLPNSALLLPVIGYAILRDVVPFEIKQKVLNVKFNYLLVFSVIFFFVPVWGMVRYNVATTGSPLGFGQVYTRYTLNKTVLEKDVEGKKQDSNKSKSFLPFDVSKMPFGLNTLLFSSERGILFYSPVFLLSLLGIVHIYKQKRIEFWLLVAIVLVNLSMYSMFGDVAGGWSFGPRYLIPSFAILSLFVGFAINSFSRNLLFVSVLIVSLVYSIAVNILGSISTILIPPIREATGLGLDSTINVSITHLVTKPLGSYVFVTQLSRYIDNQQFYILLLCLVTAITLIVLIRSIYGEARE